MLFHSSSLHSVALDNLQPDTLVESHFLENGMSAIYILLDKTCEGLEVVDTRENGNEIFELLGVRAPNYIGKK